MKTKLMTLLIVVIGFVTIHANAQAQDESRIKILATSQPGVVKLIHAIPTNEPVTVRFLNNTGVISSDEIKGDFPKGIAKRYDVSNIGNRDFRMEVSTSRLSVTYRIIPSKDKKTFAPYLEKSVRNYVMASK